MTTKSGFTTTNIGISYGQSNSSGFTSYYSQKKHALRDVVETKEYTEKLREIARTEYDNAYAKNSSSFETKIYGSLLNQSDNVLRKLQNVTSKKAAVPLVKLETIIAKFRNGQRFFFMERLALKIGNQAKRNCFTEEEQIKIKQAADILADVAKRENWNRNTKVIINKYK